MMKTYLEIQVPLRSDASWFEELRSVCHCLPVRWQAGFFHITLAFVDETPEDLNLFPVLDKHFGTLVAPTLVFDKLDAFTISSGMHIVYLTASQVPQTFLSVIESVRSDMKDAGCVIKSDFRLHVTLGRIKDSGIELANVKRHVESVSIQPFSLLLNHVDYRVFRGDILYETILNTQ